MKYLTSQFAKSKAFHVFAVSLISASLAGCGGDSGSDSGRVANYVELPMTFTSLYCPDEGVGEENCVLFNPANPYADSSLNSPVPDAEPPILYKWEFNGKPQSDVSKFYLWATAHAQSASGENQFYTADSLHKIYTNEGSEQAQEQAKRAYRSLLDNFFGSVTFAANGVDEFLLRDFVGGAIVRPGNGLNQLFADQEAAEAALSDWGYVFDTDTGNMERKTN